MTTEDAIDTLKVHRFEPGDRLLVKLATELTEEEAEHLKKQIMRWAPELKDRVAIMSPGMELEVARGLEAV